MDMIITEAAGTKDGFLKVKKRKMELVGLM
jgi:hypothetical protein